MRLFKHLFYFLAAASVLITFAACDDEEELTATIGFNQAEYTLAENGAALEIPITLSNAWPTAVTVNFTTQLNNVVAGVDFQAFSATSVTIPAGQTSANITVTPINNNFFETGARELTLTLTPPTISGITPTAITSTKITFTNDEVQGAVKVDFQEAAVTTNESEEETLTMTVRLSQAFAEALTVNFTVGGTGAEGTQFENIATKSVNFPANTTTATFEVKIKNTKNYGNSRNITFTLQAPGNQTIGLGAAPTATVTVINPVANMSVWLDTTNVFKQMWSYNTFADVAVPATGRANSDPNAGVLYNESFAFSYVPPADREPNVIGFNNSQYTPETPRGTNAFNFIRIYGGFLLDQGANTVVADIASNNSNALNIAKAIRLIPSSEGSKTGKAVIIEQDVTVFKTGGLETFTIKIKGEGTYDEDAGTISVTVEFDETAVGNGVQKRRFVFTATRRAA